MHAEIIQEKHNKMSICMECRSDAKYKLRGLAPYISHTIPTSIYIVVELGSFVGVS